MIHKDLVRFTTASNIFTVDSQSHKVLLIRVSSQSSGLHRTKTMSPGVEPKAEESNHLPHQKFSYMLDNKQE